MTSPPAPPAPWLLQDEVQMFQRQLGIVLQTHHQQVLVLVVQPMVLSAASRPADDLAGVLIAGEDWPCRSSFFFKVALPIIVGQVGVDDGASLPLGGPLVLTPPSLPRNAVSVISQAPHRHRCPEPTLTCNWTPDFGKRRWLLTGSHVCLTWKLGRSGKTHGELQGSLDNRRSRDGNRELVNLLQNPIRHFLNWMLSAEIVFRFAEIVCILPTSALTSKLNEWSAKIECTISKVGVSMPNKVRW